MTALERKTLSIFAGMKQRCYNPKNIGFKSYGGRGIAICQEWLDNPHSFAKYAIQHGFEIGKHIHRIDSTKGYYPENVEFISFKEHNHKHHGRTDYTCCRCGYSWQKQLFGRVKPVCCPKCKSYSYDKPRITKKREEK